MSSIGKAAKISAAVAWENLSIARRQRVEPCAARPVNDPQAGQRHWRFDNGGDI